MTIDDAKRYACDCASPEHHQTGRPECMVSLLLKKLQDHSLSGSVQQAREELVAGVLTKGHSFQFVCGYESALSDLVFRLAAVRAEQPQTCATCRHAKNQRDITDEYRTICQRLRLDVTDLPDDFGCRFHTPAPAEHGL